MIYCATPFADDRNLGRAYNEFLDLLKEDDWAIFIDHDAIWTTPHWYDQIVSATKAPRVGCVTAVTNRIWCRYQLAAGADPNNHDMRYHRQLGERLQTKYGSTAIDVTLREPPISGVVLAVSKAAVLHSGGFRKGLLGVDNALHRSMRAAGYRVLLMPGLYVYHWYRADGRNYVGAK